MIKSAIVDSGIFIGVKHKSDQWHNKSLSILKALADGKIKEIFISNYVILETVNFLLRKADYKTAIESYNYLLNADRITVVYMDGIISILIKELFEKYRGLSLTDCSLLVLAMKFNIKYIFSYDSSFDRVKEIKRLEEIS